MRDTAEEVVYHANHVKQFCFANEISGSKIYPKIVKFSPKAASQKHYKFWMKLLMLQNYEHITNKMWMGYDIETANYFNGSFEAFQKSKAKKKHVKFD